MDDSILMIGGVLLGALVVMVGILWGKGAHRDPREAVLESVSWGAGFMAAMGSQVWLLSGL